jgi:hypothetical protein
LIEHYDTAHPDPEAQEVITLLLTSWLFSRQLVVLVRRVFSFRWRS